VAGCKDNKQVLFNYMGWLRKQAVPKRKHGNLERTLAFSGAGLRLHRCRSTVCLLSISRRQYR